MFRTTRWSLVVAAGDTVGVGRSQALADLCRLYWYPVYAHIRRRTADRHKAEDLTQAFFTRFLEKNDIADADPARGRFRTFLLSACRHFLANQHDHDTAAKRGRGVLPLSIDFMAGEERFNREPADRVTPEVEFERRWAMTLLDQTLKELRGEYAESGKEKLFEVLKGSLAGGGIAYRELGGQLGLTEGAVKVAVHRLRQRYRDKLRAVIAETVDAPADVDDEIRDLFAALG